MTRHRRQGPALLGRRLRLPLLEVLHDERQPLGELALQDDAFVDDGGHAVEQLAAGAELAILRACARWAAKSRARRRADDESKVRLRRMLIGSLFSVGSGDVAVAQNTTVQEVVRRRDALRQALQLELQRDRAVGLAGAAAHVVAVDHAQPPAARLVFPAEEVLEALLVEERIAVAADDAPASAQTGHTSDTSPCSSVPRR